MQANDADPPPSSEGNAAPRVLRPRRAAPADAVRPTRAEVNLAHLRHNLRVLERAVASGSTPPAKIWGVLKADAYGHGAPAVARTLERAGIAGLCVALLEEAIELRVAGIRAPILVMSGYYGSRRDGLDELVENGLVPVVYDAGQIERIAAFARQGSAPVSVHLKVDTGMGRLGAEPRELDAVLGALAGHPELRLEGLMTHFACADAPDLATTAEQLRAFVAIERRAAAVGLAPQIRHAANSAALFRMPEARLDVVRPGVALFGVSPLEGPAMVAPPPGESPPPPAVSPVAAFARHRVSSPPPRAPQASAHEGLDPEPPAVAELKPVMRVRTEIVALRSIPMGGRIGYGHTWQASRPSVIATIPMGYADGLSRALSNRGSALVRGKRAPIAGTISMDLTMLDVTDLPGARVGDEAVLLGRQDGPLGRDSIEAAEIAQLTGTIPWEVLTSISRRVPRFYREP